MTEQMRSALPAPIMRGQKKNRSSFPANAQRPTPKGQACQLLHLLIQSLTGLDMLEIRNKTLHQFHNFMLANVLLLKCLF